MRSNANESSGADGNGSTDQKMVSFEIANFNLPDYPHEKIVFVKFLDDNDPRLLYLVTYNEQVKTTYMKVLKIEKSKRYFNRKVTDKGKLIRSSNVGLMN